MSVVSGVVGAIMGKDASDEQADAAKAGISAEQEMYRQSREDLAPWRETGGKAVKELWDKVLAGPGRYVESPGYKVRLAEGEKAINRNFSTGGNVLSGARAKALTRFGQDYATQDYDNWLSRWYQSLTPYQSVAGLGQTATMQGVAAGQQSAQQQSNLLQAIGNAKAAGAINTSNSITGAINSGVNNYLMYSYLNKGAAGAGTADVAAGMII